MMTNNPPPPNRAHLRRETNVFFTISRDSRSYRTEFYSCQVVSVYPSEIYAIGDFAFVFGNVAAFAARQHFLRSRSKLGFRPEDAMPSR